MQLDQLAKNIFKKEDGIYYAKDSSAISYPESGNEYCMQIEQDSFWFNHRNKIICAAVARHSPDKVFFDIGGGNGYVSEALQKEGRKVVLVEPGPVGALNAKKRGINNVICATLDDVQFNKHSIDSAGLFDVIEHIENDAAFLSNLHSYLKDGAMVYITVPAFNFLWSTTDKDAGHYRRYTLSGLKKQLMAQGFDVLYGTYVFSILPLPIFLFRAIPSFFGFSEEYSNVKERKKLHSKKKGVLSAVLARIWQWEIDGVKQGKKIFFGGSCFVVARKKPTG